MRIKKALKYIGFLIALVPFAGTACSANNTQTAHRLTPRYILDGTQEAQSGKFVYYSINSGTEYAVALKDNYKTSTSALTIPSEYNSKPVTGIWRYGFSNSRAKTITIPSGITVIDFEAFMNCKIQTLTIPATIEQIGEAAFYACTSLTKAAINNTTTTSEASSACSCVEVVDNNEGERIPCTLTTIPSFCFFNCHGLKELVLPQSIEEIEYEAFNNCRSLYSTLAFMNIKAIRSRAFQGCAALKNIYISSSFFVRDQSTNQPIGIIEDKAFDSCNADLKFYLVGATEDVQAWLNLNSNNKWRWKDETTNYATPANLYEYEITASGASYSNDWIYTTVNGEVEITSYIGPTKIEGNNVEFLSLPDELPSGSGNKVRSITIDALDPVKKNLKRIYLPRTLKRIEADMFNGDYDNLIVVDDNTKCSADQALVDASQSLTPRIILNGITDLEVIGNNAFVNMDNLKNITKLYLPYSLKAVGMRAFGNTSSNKHLIKVTDFRWDYDDVKSALKVIGREAFFKLGNSDTTGTQTNGIHKNYLSKTGTENYQLTTLVLPRTFEHFGISDSDNTTYNLGAAEANDGDFGRSAFAGSPLLEKVVFKGSVRSKVEASANSDNDTFNLIIPSYTFIMNESLRTVVFEERCGKTILFHTTSNDRPCVGWSAGKTKNDFSGDPSVQTIVLPNRYTTLRLQKYAFQGNSRGAIYLSGANGSNMYGTVNTSSIPSFLSNIALGSTGMSDVKAWNRTGAEDSYGFYFDASNTQNRYGLEQYLPTYYEVLYEDTINKPYVSVDVFVGLGTTNSANEFVVKDKCAFVCGASTATMSKYLYDRHDSSFTGTAVVPATVDRSDGTTCTVDTIGGSAFSAAYCDTTSYKDYTNYKDLTAVSVPDTIATINEYAFLRAYGITNFYSYNPSTGVSNGDYIMPSSLTYIGKQAFAFCNIKQFLNIPNSCLFYENSNNISSTAYDTSIFSNNFSLRKITFGNNSTSSTNYTTTTYTHSGSSTIYTSAIYSTNASTVKKNKSSLLLVLYRDSADYLSVSQDVAAVQTVINGNNVTCSELNGRYANGYLYGAFKMCYWVDSLVVGNTNQSTRNQPLISGVYNFSQNKDAIIYLATLYDFTANVCNLKVISFGNATTLSTPPYSFEGCEQLTKIRLPRVVGGHIPAGLFAFIENPHITFEVPSDNTGTNFVECNEGVLDLTYTGYTQIDKDAFKETNITTVIAPITDTFTIEEDAFANCTQLASFDFSNVTTTVNLNKAFRGATIPNDLFDFGSSALINFGAETFKGCSFPGHTFTFPTKTALIGTSCFQGCSVSEKELTAVTADSNLTYLQPVVVDNGSGKNNAGNDTGFKQIGDYAFYLCTSLNNFDFSKFTQLERIGNYAFSMCDKYSNATTGVVQNDLAGTNRTATICTNGIVNLPASLTNIGVGAFHSSGITSITINSSTMLFERGKDYTNDARAAYNKGGHQFRFCPSLTKVFFSDPDCAWRGVYLTKSQGDQSCYFANDGALVEVYLPTGYNLQPSNYTGTSQDKRGDSTCWGSNSSLKFYVYHTVFDVLATPAISDYWHKTADKDIAPLVFYCGSNADIIIGSAGSYAEKRPGTVYWTLVNGVTVYLGTASVNATTGLVTFQTSGYSADSNGINHA